MDISGHRAIALRMAKHYSGILTVVRYFDYYDETRVLRDFDCFIGVGATDNFHISDKDAQIGN